MSEDHVFHAHLESLGANWIDVGGKDVVQDFGVVEDEIVAMNTLGIANRSERDTVVALGDDVIELMQGLVTDNVFDLAQAGAGQRNLAVNINGRIVMDMRLLHLNDTILMDLEPGSVADGRLSHFKKNVINEDAKFLDRSGGLTKFAIFGTESARLLTTVASLDRDPEKLETFFGTAGTCNNGSDVIVQRIDFGTLPAFDVTVLAEQAESFLGLCLERNATLVGEWAQEFHRVQQRVPRFAVDRKHSLFGAELADDVIPLEADLESMIDFNKGCYLGQEIIARLDSRGEPAKKLRWFESKKKPEFVQVNGKSVGSIVTSVPHRGLFFNAAFVKRDFNEPGTELDLGEEKVTLQALEE